MPCLIPCSGFGTAAISRAVRELCEHLGVTVETVFPPQNSQEAGLVRSTGRTLDLLQSQLASICRPRAISSSTAAPLRCCQLDPANRLCSFTGFAPQSTYPAAASPDVLSLTFPGMNPYLEHPDRWSTVHNRLIVTLTNALTPQLLPQYQVDIEEFMKWLGSTPCGSSRCQCSASPHSAEAPTNGRRPFSD